MNRMQCSCGRTFSQRISLDRHCNGSGHTPVAETAVTPDPDEIYARALAVMAERMLAQQAYDRDLLREPVLMEPTPVGPSLQEMGAAAATLAGFAAQTTRQFVGALSLVLRTLMVLLFLSGLLFSGLKLGSFLADHSPEEGPSRPHSRQLIGANR